MYLNITICDTHRHIPTFHTSLWANSVTNSNTVKSTNTRGPGETNSILTFQCVGENPSNPTHTCATCQEGFWFSLSVLWKRGDANSGI